MVFDSEKWMPLKNCPLWSHNFLHVSPFLCPYHVKTFHLMVEMALLHSLSGKPFEKCQKASNCSAGDCSCHTMPVGCVIELAFECVSVRTAEYKAVVVSVRKGFLQLKEYSAGCNNWFCGLQESSKKPTFYGSKLKRHKHGIR